MPDGLYTCLRIAARSKNRIIHLLA